MNSSVETDAEYVRRERRARSAARRQGLRLVKSRIRTQESYQWGTYMLVDANTNWVVASGAADGFFGLLLDDVEDALVELSVTA